MKNNKKNTKSSEIKLRITTQDKETLEYAAKKRNLSLSAYVRDMCLSASNTYYAVAEVETDNIFNEIYHYFKKQGNTESADDVKTLYEEYTRRRNKS